MNLNSYKRKETHIKPLINKSTPPTTTTKIYI